MRKEYRKWLVAFFTFSVTLIFSINYLYINTKYYNGFFDTPFRNVPTDLTIINLGSSYGQYGLEYSGIKHGFNFGLPSQDLEHDYKNIKNFSANLKEGAIVILPVAYFSLSFSLSQDKVQFNALNPRYYRYLPKADIIEFNWKDYLRYRWVPAFSAGENIKCIFQDKENIENIYLPMTENQVGQTNILQVAIKKAADQKIDFQSKEEQVQTLNNIITFCKKKGFIPVLITTPYTKYYNGAFSDELLKQFDSNVNLIAQENQVVYLNYSKDARFTDNIDLFIDSDHLNLKGRRLFSNILFDDLRNRQILK